MVRGRNEKRPPVRTSHRRPLQHRNGQAAPVCQGQTKGANRNTEMQTTVTTAPVPPTVPAARYTLVSWIESQDVEMIPDGNGEYGEYQARAMRAAMSAYQTRTSPEGW